MHWIVSLLDDADGDCVWHWNEFVSQLGAACFFKVFLLWFCLIRIEARLVRARLVFRPSPQKTLTQARAEKVRFFCSPVFGLTLLGWIKPTKNLYQKSIPQLYDELEPSNHGQVSQHVPRRTSTNPHISAHPGSKDSTEKNTKHEHVIYVHTGQGYDFFIYPYTYIYIYIYTYVYVCVFLSLHHHLSTCMAMYIHMYIYIYIYISYHIMSHHITSYHCLLYYFLIY